MPYEDHRGGPAIVLIQGLDGSSWEQQTPALLAAGHRVVHHDLPAGYTVDALAADLAARLERWDLTACVLVGASLGTGVVVRCLARYGSARVRKAVLIAAVPPFLPRTGDNPDGIDGSAFADSDVLRTDYRDDLPRIDVPVLLLHGEDDRVLPIDATANRLPDLIADLRYEVIPAGPHDLARSHPELVNRYLLDFVAA